MNARLVAPLEAMNTALTRERIGAPAGAPIFWIALWSFAGVSTALHYALYYDIPWGVAFWWGLKDWYLWGLLSLPIAAHARRSPLTREGLAGAIGRHVAAAIAFAVLHSIVAVTLSFLFEEIGDLAFVGTTAAHFVKKLPLSLTIYAAIAAVSMPSHAVRHQASEQASKTKPQVEHIERLLVRGHDREFIIAVDQIIRIEAEGNYARIHTGSHSVLERKTMKSLESILPPKRFIRVHRSHLVNVEQIDEIARGSKGEREVILADGSRLPMGRTFKGRLESLVARSG